MNCSNVCIQSQTNFVMKIISFNQLKAHYEEDCIFITWNKQTWTTNGNLFKIMLQMNGILGATDTWSQNFHSAKDLPTFDLDKILRPRYLWSYFQFYLSLWHWLLRKESRQQINKMGFRRDHHLVWLGFVYNHSFFLADNPGHLRYMSVSQFGCGFGRQGGS